MANLCRHAVSYTNDVVDQWIGETKMSEFNNMHEIIAQYERRRQQRMGKVSKPPVITISRQTGSNGTEVAKHLGRKLGWKVWDRELVDKIAHDTHAQRQMVEHLDEHIESMIEEMLEAIFSTTMMTSETYLRHLFGIILSIGQQGHAIIVGRGANFLLPRALNVRIIASLAYRIETLMRREEVSREEAEHRIVRSDEGRAEFVKKAYDADVVDVTRYDLTLRMDGFRIQDAVQILQTTMDAKFPQKG